jgi:NAD(P)-dependent dehydrogenase (short-subunit alcohol dehydrogenase family)
MDDFLIETSKKIKEKNHCHHKTAIITGGSGRIGSVFAKILLQNKTKVICLSRDQNKFEKFKKSLATKEKKNIFWYECNLEDLNKIDKIVKIIKKKFKKIDLLINNASSSYRGSDFKYDSNLITKEINNITTGTILLTEKVLPTLRKQKESKIINIGSLWGIRAPKFKTYLNMNNGPTPIIAIGKSGLMNYTKYLAERESKYKITVNNLVPGWFPRKGKKVNKSYIKSICNNIPLKRIGKLNDLISPIIFLLSNGSKYFNGQDLIVDGGYTIY